MVSMIRLVLFHTKCYVDGGFFNSVSEHVPNGFTKQFTQHLPPEFSRLVDNIDRRPAAVRPPSSQTTAPPTPARPARLRLLPRRPPMPIKLPACRCTSPPTPSPAPARPHRCLPPAARRAGPDIDDRRPWARNLWV